MAASSFPTVKHARPTMIISRPKNEALAAECDCFALFPFEAVPDTVKSKLQANDPKWQR